MQYRRLGNSGVSVSTVALGSWLTFGHKVSQSEAMKCVRRAFELGVNFFDTANVYAEGRAEEVLGKALKPLPRNQLMIGTKAYFPVGPGPNDRGLSRKHIFEQVHASLRRLDTSYIDLFQCHRYDPGTPLDETLRAIDDLVAQGDVLYGGVSEWSAQNISEAVTLSRDWGLRRLVSNQPQYHMLERQIEKNGVAETCAREGLGILAFSPLAQGVLTGKYTSTAKPPLASRAAEVTGRQFMGRLLSDENLAKTEELKRIADEAGFTLPEVSLAWCLRRPEVSAVIIGASNVAQLEENVVASDLGLTEEVVEAIEAVVGR